MRIVMNKILPKPFLTTVASNLANPPATIWFSSLSYVPRLGQLQHSAGYQSFRFIRYSGEVSRPGVCSSLAFMSVRTLLLLQVSRLRCVPAAYPTGMHLPDVYHMIGLMLVLAQARANLLAVGLTCEDGSKAGYSRGKL